MAEQIARGNQYQYTANSNLVLQANRSELPRRDHEPSGEPESLWGKINPKDFGSRAQRSTLNDIQAKKKKAKHVAECIKKAYGYSNVLAATEYFDEQSYRPRTKETRETYELILAFVHQNLGDQAQDVIRSAADDILKILKNENLKDFDKKREIESFIGTIAPDRFAQLVNLGVAVVFDEEEEQEDEYGTYEVESGEEEEDDDGVEAETSGVLGVGQVEDDEDKEIVTDEENEGLKQF
ncbi:unnamed protein product [Rhizophagus irregularis]|nr:unnamed protein product [Rhizophagus irregularis]